MLSLTKFRSSTSKFYSSLVTGVCLFLFYPLAKEAVLKLKAVLRRAAWKRRREVRSKEQVAEEVVKEILGEDFEGKWPIVYSPGYNITAFGLEKAHPFDSQKYGRVYNYLVEWGVISKEEKLLAPLICSRAYLYESCTFWHLAFLNYSIYIGKCVELPLFILPAWVLRWRALNPMLRATYGTICASFMAIQRGLAINLSGGYHHACCNQGGGFCIYPDITISINLLRRFCGIKRVMIIDLDAHQGNGHERDFLDDNDVYIIDCYRPDIYPGDHDVKRAISKELHVYPSDDDDSYLDKIRCIPQCIREFEPEFILYNAGTDIMAGDPLSGLNISENGVIERDELVINSAFDNNIPLCMVLSGGYQKCNAECIAKSIQNVFELLS
ncbi:unnamed protein product [Moneuplotes crassus]|uniref:Histone deacetylase domain-containing protein n=1 Tax=Euplotes crassus TaxID=5936 RepID=A0AAD1XGV4_EUPCR|nr:unnamed protein product [Moneuplotes crassus]